MSNDSNNTNTASVLDDIMSDDTSLSFSDYRGFYTAKYGTETSLSDEAIAMLISDTPNAGETDPDTWATMMQAVEMELQDDTSGLPEADEAEEHQANVERVSSVIDKLNDDRFKATINEVLDAGETVKRGPATILLLLNTIWSPMDWDKVPIPGSLYGETGNRPYDRKTFIPSGEKRKVTESWFKTAVEQLKPMMPEGDGRTLQDALFDVQEALKKPENRADASNAPKRREMFGWPQAKKDRFKARVSDRIRGYRTILEKSCSIKFKMDKINALECAACDFDYEIIKVDGKQVQSLKETVTPLHVWDKAAIKAGKPGASLVYTVTTFLKLDVDSVALMSNPTFEDLRKTLDRDTEALNKAKREAKFKIEDAKDWERGFCSVANYVDDKDGITKVQRWLASLKNEREASNLLTEREQALWDINEARLKFSAVIDPFKKDIERIHRMVNVDQTHRANAA